MSDDHIWLPLIDRSMTLQESLQSFQSKHDREITELKEMLQSLIKYLSPSVHQEQEGSSPLSPAGQQEAELVQIKERPQSDEVVNHGKGLEQIETKGDLIAGNEPRIGVAHKVLDEIPPLMDNEGIKFSDDVLEKIYESIQLQGSMAGNSSNNRFILLTHGLGSVPSTIHDCDETLSFDPGGESVVPSIDALDCLLLSDEMNMGSNFPNFANNNYLGPLLSLDKYVVPKMVTDRVICRLSYKIYETNVNRKYEVYGDLPDKTDELAAYLGEVVTVEDIVHELGIQISAMVSKNQQVKDYSALIAYQAFDEMYILVEEEILDDMVGISPFDLGGDVMLFGGDTHYSRTILTRIRDWQCPHVKLIVKTNLFEAYWWETCGYHSEFLDPSPNKIEVSLQTGQIVLHTPVGVVQYGVILSLKELTEHSSWEATCVPANFYFEMAKSTQEMVMVVVNKLTFDPGGMKNMALVISGNSLNRQPASLKKYFGDDKGCLSRIPCLNGFQQPVFDPGIKSQGSWSLGSDFEDLEVARELQSTDNAKGSASSPAPEMVKITNSGTSKRIGGPELQRRADLLILSTAHGVKTLYG